MVVAGTQVWFQEVDFDFFGSTLVTVSNGVATVILQAPAPTASWAGIRKPEPLWCHCPRSWVAPSGA
jgi:hypothetical protein